MYIIHFNIFLQHTTPFQMPFCPVPKRRDILSPSPYGPDASGQEDIGSPDASGRAKNEVLFFNSLLVQLHI